ncbi:MAG TPA: histidine kinase N-terminal 7TM domain-containing protein, partial [Thermoanaerobaculia bacterium]|nr:histidine kinase N-terminal 7TM domain-containing protein [Thermoanaerobaculia bacterium]
MSDLLRLFSTANYAANALSLSTAFAGFAILLLGLAVALRSRALSSRLFFLVTIAFSGWLLAFSAMYASTDANIALGWGRIGYFCASLIPAAVFHFASVNVGRARGLRVPIIAIWTLCVTIALLSIVTARLVPSVQHFPWGFYTTGSPFGGIIALAFGGIAVAAMVLFLRAYREAEGNARERTGALLLAFV